MPYKNKEEQAKASRRHYERNKEKMKARAVAHRARIKASGREIIDAAKSVPCMDCGETYPPYVMDFDHVRGDKLLNVSEYVNRGISLAKLQEEIDKCEVVCANCHRIRTHSMRDSGGSTTSGS